MEANKEQEVRTLSISDGVDSATLTSIRNGWKVELNVPGGESENKQRLLEASAQAIALNSGGRLEYWIEGANDYSDQIPIAAGYSPCRDLWRLTRPLPIEQSQLTTRPFELEDLPSIISINNRAFSWHPEQSNQTKSDFEGTMNEPWFDSAGLRVLELEENIIGFCWTKIHHDLNPKRGEIFVIAIDPDHQGNGTGKQLTLSGLNWLQSNGVTEAMLYVESDNAAANHVYSSLGFQHELTNRAYERFIR